MAETERSGSDPRAGAVTEAQAENIRADLAAAIIEAVRDGERERHDPSAVRRRVMRLLSKAPVSARLAPPEPGPAAAELARAVVLWDGANEDGCAFCGVEWPENDDGTFLPHEKTCAVVVHRLELIAALVAEDPAPSSPKGERLKVLAKTQERYERATIRLA